MHGPSSRTSWSDKSLLDFFEQTMLNYWKCACPSVSNLTVTCMNKLKEHWWAHPYWELIAEALMRTLENIALATIRQKLRGNTSGTLEARSHDKPFHMDQMLDFHVKHENKPQTVMQPNLIQKRQNWLKHRKTKKARRILTLQYVREKRISMEERCKQWTKKRT